MGQFRTCIDCKQIKPLINFLIDKSKKTGYKSVCLICGRIRNGYQSDLNSPRDFCATKGTGMTSAEKSEKWTAENPKRRKEIDAAYRERNRLKNAKRMRKYRLKNPDAYRNWVDNNPEKAKANWATRSANLRGAKKYAISAKEWARLYAGPCFYCNTSGKMTVDHVIPISRGGVHSVGNLVPACNPCNKTKHAKTITEWQRWKLTNEL